MFSLQTAPHHEDAGKRGCYERKLGLVATVAAKHNLTIVRSWDWEFGIAGLGDSGKHCLFAEYVPVYTLFYSEGPGACDLTQAALVSGSGQQRGLRLTARHEKHGLRRGSTRCALKGKHKTVL